MEIFILEIQQARESLILLQKEPLMSPHPDLLLAVQDQAKKLAKHTQVEGSFLKKRLRIKWLRKGDHNTSFFHQIVNERQYTNKITSLRCTNGTLATGHAKVVVKILYFYSELLGKAYSAVNPDSSSYITSLLPRFLSSELQ